MSVSLSTRSDDESGLQQAQLDSAIAISAKHNKGLSHLTTAPATAVFLNASNRQDTILTNARHLQALARANEALLRAHQGLSNDTTGDFIAMDIRQALHHLGEISGTISTDDLLGNIFGKFCIGK